MRSVVLVLMCGVTLAACQSDYIGDASSPYYTAPVGSRLVLNRSLAVPAERADVLLQYGRVVPDGNAYMYEPHCELELGRRLPAAQTIAPDEFIVTRVSQELAHSVDAGTLRYAAASKVSHVAMRDLFDGPSIRAFVTHMYLDSERQPQVFRLSCGVWGYPREDEHLSINQIRQTLGDVITLRLAEPRT